MSQTLVTNIGLLVTNDSRHDGTPLGLIHGAAMLIEGGKVTWAGESSHAPDVENKVDAHGKCVIPGFVDSHNHLIFAGDRAEEFRARMMGQKYSAGGISSTVAKTRAASDEELRRGAQSLIQEGLKSGTTTVEIKSGYGLTVEDEVRSLQIAREFTDEVTFLGAHVVPAEFKDSPDAYVDLVCGEMLQHVKPHAKWIDVFCDKGAFTPDQTRRILNAGIEAGLLPRLHANQLEPGEGIKLGAELGAASVDHITFISDSDIHALASSSTVATLLPGAQFSTRSIYPDSRPLFEAGINVALASDCNPGSSFTSNMSFVIALAVREHFFSPEQAIWSATQGGAEALKRTDIGNLRVGSKADFILLDSESYIHLAYRPGVWLISEVWKNGSRVN
jgi:imidazolonepropionase